MISITQIFAVKGKRRQNEDLCLVCMTATNDLRSWKCEVPYRITSRVQTFALPVRGILQSAVHVTG